MRKIKIIALLTFFGMIYHPSSLFSQSQKDNLTIKVVKKSYSLDNLKGDIQLSIVNGSGPYLIKCFGPNLNIVFENKVTVDLNNLDAGRYLFIARDKAGNITHKEIYLSVD